MKNAMKISIYKQLKKREILNQISKEGVYIEQKINN